MSPKSHITSNGLSRRDWLRFSGAAALGGAMILAGCKTTQMTGGSFLQPWQEHMDWTNARWRNVLSGMKDLGCDSLFLQWVGIEGESLDKWDARGRMLQRLMDEAAKLGMGVHIGLPYNENWWAVIAQSDADVANYLQNIAANSIAYMRSVTWPKHPAFAGWYIPYELEQYDFGRSQARLEMVAGWLKQLSDVAIETSGREPSVSTYYSVMGTPEQLATMWSYILDRVILRPMIQDGVGVHGMKNYANLEPLHQMLLKRGANFDLIVELFEMKQGAANVVGEFDAQTAGLERLRSQWNVAQAYGSKRVVAFALEPWASQDTAEGVQLRNVWKSTMRAQQRQ
ncbi:DUF4434 domain-containing protein [Diaphorobacter sp. HDW4A]|uniref:DUF4434 domain-containing protein n=1 Tax=Diaphorobacter sp. HDW4A TaxID=2714924 RepID=UPI001409CC5B|nr:DUF4434 domain-containing protein [Diaphorobacter sp. HDW4A]QIL82150.1 DUF4434 domain-containing protein [Diaphorobacter sp. HDW4A]